MVSFLASVISLQAVTIGVFVPTASIVGMSRAVFSTVFVRFCIALSLTTSRTFRSLESSNVSEGK